MPSEDISNSNQIKEIWRKADGICFDVDSTACRDEAIDELAKYCGSAEKVQEWTAKAMSGGVTFRESLDARLKLINPKRQQLFDFIENNPPKLSPGLRELVTLLQSQNKQVFLVSGGFRSIINQLAKVINVPLENVYANKIFFDEDGSYSGFDEQEPTSDSGGKPLALQMIKDKHCLKSLVMIGDGVTDLEACPPADAFIGYGGNVIREKVKASAKWFVTDFQELITELQKLS